MDDEAYAAALLRILTNPAPSGIDPDDPYGRADDGIDRYDGFGRDVWVESVEVVGGEHGAELEVSFALNLPAELAAEGMPDRGSVRLPADQEWRELSGYGEPGAYAPSVARTVECAARDLVSHHHAQLRGDPPVVPAPPGSHWPTLLAELAASEDGDPVEMAPGRIEVRSSSAVLTVLVTPEQWERVVARIGDGVDDIGEYVAGKLGAKDDDEHVMVFYDGELVLSTREQLPPVRGQALARRRAEIRASRPDAELRLEAYWPPRPRTSLGPRDRS